MHRVFPTVRQLVLATIAGIASHPRIKKPEIYYPVADFGQPPEEVKIQRYRTYDGIELQEPGLTCAVYPLYSSRTLKTAASSKGTNKSVWFEPYTLGSGTDASSNYIATYSLIVQLYYQDMSINQTMQLPFNTLFSPLGLPVQHGYTSTADVAASGPLTSPPLNDNLNNNLRAFSGAYFQQDEITVEINPGEEIMREYLDLLRVVLDDMPTLRPLAVRSSSVKLFDFPTTSWNRENTDIYFHTAWLLWELSLFPPRSWRDIYFLPTLALDIEASPAKV